MSHYGIRAIDRTCGSYGPGHRVHWIQAKKSAEEGPVIHVSVVVHDDGRVDLEGHELNLTMWNHDPGRLQYLLDYGGRAVWKPRCAGCARPLRVPLELGLVGQTNAVPSGCTTSSGRVDRRFPRAGNEGGSRLHGAWAEHPCPRCGGDPPMSPRFTYPHRVSLSDASGRRTGPLAPMADGRSGRRNAGAPGA
jgi:hypothetical protein